jgi:hypothetical protein
LHKGRYSLVLVLVACCLFGTDPCYSQGPNGSLAIADEEGTPENGVFVLKEWPGTDSAQIVDMGVLDGFYRHTQMQGHLVQNGLYLYQVPDFWCTGSDFSYLKKESAKEVFFVDEFSVTRFLGGYNQDWNHGGLQLKTNDMAYLDKNGRVRYRLNLVKGRLQPYIENGYTEFIIGFDNIWDLSRDPEQSGPFGPTAPPRNWSEWYNFIKKVCGAMTCVYPEEVQQHLKFKIGNEYNQKKSFTGTHEDYLKMYDYSAAAIRSIFPEAEIMPGEIGGGASGPDNAVDYPDLFEHFVSGTSYAGGTHPSPVSVLARSSHSFPNMRDLSPRERVEGSINSFEEVLEGKPVDFRESLSLEYHQFGVIGSPLVASESFNGSRSASWQFQVLFRAKAPGYLDRAWSWNKSEQIAISKTQETHLLNGVGWLYSVLDHSRGDQAHLLVTLQPEGSACDVTSVAFVNENRVTLLLSSWSESFGATDSIPVRVEIPASLLPFELDLQKAKTISSTGAEDAYIEIRSDLEAADNLQAVYMENPGILGTIRGMASNYYSARTMVYGNMSKYEPLQQESLTLNPVQEGVFNIQIKPGELELEISGILSHDEVRVLVFTR